jgi:hypothetical protein
VPVVGGRNVLGATLLQTDLYPYSTYAVGARIPKGQWPEALVWDSQDPYLYLRIDSHGAYDFAILGGADHKTGQTADTRDAFADMEHTLLRLLPDAAVTHQWSGQVIETRDGLPYIGHTAPGQFIATGFSGNGMTFGTLGAIMARDALTGTRNPWSDLFSASRTHVVRGLGDYLSENKDYPYYLIRDRFAGVFRQAYSCGQRLARAKSSTWTGTRSPCLAMQWDISRCCRPSARTWAVSFAGTRRRHRGTARATGLGFPRPVRSSPGPPSRRSNHSNCDAALENARHREKRSPQARALD